MRTLYLLRHAKSSWDEPELADRERPLAPRGRRAARRIAAFLTEPEAAIDLVLCSTATRTRQTLEVIAPSLGGSPDIRYEDDLYQADADDLLATLRGLDDSVSSVLLIGHNPAMQELVIELAAEDDGAGDRAGDALARAREKFPTAALATLTIGGRWAELGPGGARLGSVVWPRDLEG